jgi:hypothetical protein
MLLWVYIHTGQAWKICLANGGNRTYIHITDIIFTWVHNTNTENHVYLFDEYLNLALCKVLYMPVDFILVEVTDLSNEGSTPVS